MVGALAPVVVVPGQDYTMGAERFRPTRQLRPRCGPEREVLVLAITADLTHFTTDPTPIEKHREAVARAIEKLSKIKM